MLIDIEAIAKLKNCIVNYDASVPLAPSKSHDRQTEVYRINHILNNERTYEHMHILNLKISLRFKT